MLRVIPTKCWSLIFHKSDTKEETHLLLQNFLFFGGHVTFVDTLSGHVWFKLVLENCIQMIQS